MPGIVNDSQATYYLDFDNQKKLVGKPPGRASTSSIPVRRFSSADFVT